MGLIAWIKSFFEKVKSFIAKAWNLASPFLKEVLGASAAKALAVLQELALTAVSQIATQGLPTDEAKRKAFADFMTAAAKQKGIELKDFELNLLRETAYAIWKKAQEQ